MATSKTIPEIVITPPDDESVNAASSSESPNVPVQTNVAAREHGTVNKQGAGGVTPLHEFALQEPSYLTPHTIDGLIGQGYDPNARDAEGATPIHYAVSVGHHYSVGCLANRRGDINAQTIQGLTPLHLAVVQGDVKTVNELLLRGADKTIKDAQGLTPLDYVAVLVHGITDKAVELLKGGAEFTSDDERDIALLQSEDTEQKENYAKIEALLGGKELVKATNSWVDYVEQRNAHAQSSTIEHP